VTKENEKRKEELDESERAQKRMKWYAAGDPVKQAAALAEFKLKVVAP
jgi:hypothetical protein